MGFLGGKQKSIESLHNSIQSLEGAEEKLIILRNEIQKEIADVELLQEKKETLMRDADKATDRKINQLATVDVLNDEIQELLKRIEEVKSEITERKSQADREDLTWKNLSDEAKGLELRLKSSHASIESGKEVFNEKKGALSSFRQKMESANKNDRKKRNSGPSATPIKPLANQSKITTLHALGDVHGWAPGLMNYMRHHQLAELSISGHDIVDKESMIELFQSPVERTHQQRSLPRVGLDGNPMRIPDIFTPFHRVQVKENHSTEALICVGDVIDRGDHNELVLEILRQSIYSNMGHRWVTLGNHEQMVLEDDFKRWSKNELNYMAEANKDHAGSYLHQPALTGCATMEDGLSQNFRILQGGLGALLLTQHLALMETLEGEGLAEYIRLSQPVFHELSWTTKDIKKVVESSTWELHERGVTFLETVRSLSMKNAVLIPGGIGIVYLHSHILMHAEPNGLDDLDENMWDDLKKFVTASGCQFGFARMEKRKLLNPSYLWARNWGESPHNSIRPLLNSHLRDSVKTLVHGHQAGSGIRTSNSLDAKTITVKSIDEGMTPYYFYNYGHFEQAFNPTRIPEGYKAVWD